jgi:hypothetical protein
MTDRLSYHDEEAAAAKALHDAEHAAYLERQARLARMKPSEAAMHGPAPIDPTAGEVRHSPYATMRLRGD